MAGEKKSRWVEVDPIPHRRIDHLRMALAARLDRRYGWDKLRVPLAILTLSGLRDRMRANNLFDTGVPADDETPSANDRAFRSADGRWNDTDHPSMGAARTPFGRNVRPEDNPPEAEPMLSTPDPRLVSETLFTRDQFIPATTLNVLAAAWLQFEIHDWFSHSHDPSAQYTLPSVGAGGQSGELVIDRTMSAGGKGRFLSEDTHWWDGSQIYGSNELHRKALRDGAYLRVDQGTIPTELTSHLDFRGRHAGFWAGWATLHSLFAGEHNAICDHLCKEEARSWDDDELFETARLVNVALMAKIHTTEWTPAVLAHPTTQTAMRLNWWGISRRLKRSYGRLSDNEVISGILGAPTSHHGSPYCLTEEFVAVYRMHSLIPDDFVFHSLDGAAPVTLGFNDLRASDAIPRVRDLGMATVLHSFGVAHPGAITLHNFPRSLQALQPFGADGDGGGGNGRQRQGDRVLDLAAVDIFRDRERGVPRYNAFREAFHKPRLQAFEQLTSNPAWAEEIRQVYGNDIDAVDLMTGLHAEDLPKGFGFSDTAFRLFVLMASRRLRSDRFFTVDYDAEHYTRTGLRWIEENTMKDVLLRQYKQLAPSLGPVDNAFKPWARVPHR